MQSLGSAITNSIFSPMVKTTVIFLPRITSDESTEIVWRILEALSAVQHVRFYVIPPPAELSPIYDAVINCLSAYVDCFYVESASRTLIV